MNRSLWMFPALLVSAIVAMTPSAAAAHSAHDGGGKRNQCSPTRPGTEFYAGGRVASTAITVPNSRCTTISVSNIRDPRVPGDRCQTFLVGFFSTDGTDPTYTEPMEACSVPARKRTVLATNVPDGSVFMVLYDVDYIDPVIQTVRFRVWR